jgi:hypothetical protein
MGNPNRWIQSDVQNGRLTPLSHRAGLHTTATLPDHAGQALSVCLATHKWVVGPEMDVNQLGRYWARE